MTSTYNLRHDGDQYRVTKFDDDMNVESSYLMTAEECECPAGHRSTCRHRQMFPFLLSRIDSHWMYEFESGRWVGTEADEDEDVAHLGDDPIEAQPEPERITAHDSEVDNPPTAHQAKPLPPDWKQDQAETSRLPPTTFKRRF